jgi:hypothetical protein
MSNAVGAVSISFNELFNSDRTSAVAAVAVAVTKWRRSGDVSAEMCTLASSLFLVRRVHNARAHETSSVVSRRTREHFNGTGDRA